MATVTAGYTWTSGETVTPAKLNSAAAPTVVVADNEITTAKLASNAVETAKILDANVTPAKLSQPLTLATAQNTTSGTSIDFTGIPSWVKRITVMLNGVSITGSNVLVQIGAGSVVTSGYNTNISTASAATNTVQQVSSTSGFIVINQSSADVLYAQMNLLNVSGNSWVSTHFGNSAGWGIVGGGNYALSGALDRIRVTTVSGTDTFDAGSVNIMYEG
jgi:hypothetical protein